MQIQIQQRPDSGSERYIWPFSRSIIWLLKQGGCRRVILEEGGPGEKAEVCKFPQEFYLKSVETVLL